MQVFKPAQCAVHAHKSGLLPLLGNSEKLFVGIECSAIEEGGDPDASVFLERPHGILFDGSQFGSKPVAGVAQAVGQVAPVPHILGQGLEDTGVVPNRGEGRGDDRKGLGSIALRQGQGIDQALHEHDGPGKLLDGQFLDSLDTHHIVDLAPCGFVGFLVWAAGQQAHVAVDERGERVALFGSGGATRSDRSRGCCRKFACSTWEIGQPESNRLCIFRSGKHGQQIRSRFIVGAGFAGFPVTTHQSDEPCMRIKFVGMPGVNRVDGTNGPVPEKFGKIGTREMGPPFYVVNRNIVIVESEGGEGDNMIARRNGFG